MGGRFLIVSGCFPHQPCAFFQGNFDVRSQASKTWGDHFDGSDWWNDGQSSRKITEYRPYVSEAVAVFDCSSKADSPKRTVHTSGSAFDRDTPVQVVAAYLCHILGPKHLFFRANKMPSSMSTWILSIYVLALVAPGYTCPCRNILCDDRNRNRSQPDPRPVSASLLDRETSWYAHAFTKNSMMTAPRHQLEELSCAAGGTRVLCISGGPRWEGRRRAFDSRPYRVRLCSLRGKGRTNALLLCPGRHLARYTREDVPFLRSVDVHRQHPPVDGA